MTEQCDLFTPRKTRADQIYAAFVKFHRENPVVWKLFERFTLQLIGSGREHYSSDAITHRIRWEMAITTTGELKINDHFTAYYGRLFHAKHPEHYGFYRNRKLKSQDQSASKNDRQVFIDGDPENEETLMQQLANL